MICVAGFVVWNGSLFGLVWVGWFVFGFCVWFSDCLFSFVVVLLCFLYCSFKVLGLGVRLLTVGFGGCICIVVFVCWCFVALCFG